MDKTTKAFVIGACSVVIAMPVFWIGSQVINGIQQAHRRRRIEVVMAEQKRQASRFVPCSNRIFREGSRLLDEQDGVEMYESHLPKLEPVADTSFASEAMDDEEEPLIQGLGCHKGEELEHSALLVQIGEGLVQSSGGGKIPIAPG